MHGGCKGIAALPLLHRVLKFGYRGLAATRNHVENRNRRRMHKRIGKHGDPGDAKLPDASHLDPVEHLDSQALKMFQMASQVQAMLHYTVAIRQPQRQRNCSRSAKGYKSASSLNPDSS